MKNAPNTGKKSLQPRKKPLKQSSPSTALDPLFEDEAKKKKQRVRPGRSQERRIWDKSGSRCQFCGQIGIAGLELHHLDENPDNTEDGNLIAICGACHERYKHGEITRNDAYRVKYYLDEGKPPYPLLSDKPETPKPPAGSKFVATGNSGSVQQADTINNSTRITYGAKPRGPIILPGSIASDGDKYRYMEYLIKRLSEFREKGIHYGQKWASPVHPGVIRKQIEQQWKSLPKDLPLSTWPNLIDELQGKIDQTIIGRNNRSKGTRNYESFDEFMA